MHQETAKKMRLSLFLLNEHDDDDSMSGILMNLCLPTADTIVHNYSRILFHQSCNASCNKIVQWFADIGVF